MSKWQKIFEKNLDEHIESGRSQICENFDFAQKNLCESEIERIMLAELIFVAFGYNYPPNHIHDPTKPAPMPDKDVVIIPQLEIGQYRADFAVLIRNFADDVLRLVIECDGHDFHEKTKQQAQRDKKRDRDIMVAGWQVFRFTGSEIWRDIPKCLAELDAYVSDWIEVDLIKRGVIRGPKEGSE